MLPPAAAVKESLGGVITAAFLASSGRPSGDIANPWASSWKTPRSAPGPAPLQAAGRDDNPWAVDWVRERPRSSKGGAGFSGAPRGRSDSSDAAPCIAPRAAPRLRAAPLPAPAAAQPAKLRSRVSSGAAQEGDSRLLPSAGLHLGASEQRKCVRRTSAAGKFGSRLGGDAEIPCSALPPRGRSCPRAPGPHPPLRKPWSRAVARPLALDGSSITKALKASTVRLW